MAQISQKSSISIDEYDNNETDKKRKRAETSSVSSALETSTGPDQSNEKQKKKKKKRGKHDIDEDIETKVRELESQSLSQITKQLKDINQKLTNVITRDDGNLRDIIKETFSQIKDDLLSSVYKRIDILEGKLFDKETENEGLKKEITKLENEIKSQKCENETLREKIHTKDKQTEGRMNDLEQYSRINNLRIDGIAESSREQQSETEQKIVDTLNRYIPNLKLEIKDLEIGHRLGKPNSDGKPRQIIVQFCSRRTKTEILRQRKMVRNTGIYIKEDLTRTNQYVLSCLRKKLPDEVASAWSRNGILFYKNKTDSIYRVNFDDYQTWIDLPWPAPETPVNKWKTSTAPKNVWLSPVGKSGQTGS